MKLKISCGSKSNEIDVNFTQEPSKVDSTPTVSQEQENRDDDLQGEIDKQETAVSTLGQLRELIASHTNVDPARMKIIHKGRSLSGEAATPLDVSSFREGDKLLIMGSARAALIDDAAFKQLVNYEKKNLQGLQAHFDSLRVDLEELEKCFLDAEKHREMAKRIEKRMRVFNEESTRHMVALDSMEMSKDGASEEQVKRNREKRKTLINGIETLLNQNDALLRRLEELNRKCEEAWVKMSAL